MTNPSPGNVAEPESFSTDLPNLSDTGRYPPEHDQLTQGGRRYIEARPTQREYIAGPPLALDPQQLREGMLSYLVRFYGLDVYRDKNLSYRAAIDMKKGAVLMTIVVFFELLAWTAFWVVIFNGGNYENPSALSLIIAPLLSIFLAATILHFETQIFTSSASSGNGNVFTKSIKFTMAFILRFCIVIFSGLLTAQPVELLVFSNRIDERVHQEAVIAKTVAIIHDIKKKKKELSSSSNISKNVSYITTQRKDEAQREVRAQEGRIEKMRRELADSIAGEKRGRINVKYYKKLEDEATLAIEEENLTDDKRAELIKKRTIYKRRQFSWRTRQANARQQKEMLESEIPRIEVHLQSLKKKKRKALNEFGKEINSIKSILEKDIIELRAFIEYLKNFDPNKDYTKPLTLSDKTTITFERPSRDAFTRLRVLDDLVNGRLPMWPDVRYSKDEQKIYDELNLPPRRGTSGAEEATMLLKEEAKSFANFYWGIFAFAMVIPMMAIFNKLLISSELAAYYSQEKS